MQNPTRTSLSRRAFFLRGEHLGVQARVALNDTCFALNGIYCESCRDVCDTGAIRFQLHHGAVPRPVLEADLCSQCGECARVCPQIALKVLPRSLAPADG